MKLQFITTKEYYLLVDTEAPLKRKALVWNVEGNFGVIEGNPEADLITVRYEKKFSSVALRTELSPIIAHLPLTGSPVLEGVPVMVDEEDVLKSATSLAIDALMTKRETMDVEDMVFIEIFTMGYKVASQKKYSDEDLITIIGKFHEMNMAYLTGKEDDNLNIPEFVESLKPVPVDFIPEMEEFKIFGGVTDEKFKLNSEGKLQGRYVYGTE
jgi:hypothetical protein